MKTICNQAFDIFWVPAFDEAPNFDLCCIKSELLGILKIQDPIWH